MIITKETHSQFPFQNSIVEKLGIATNGTAVYTDGQIGRALTNSSTNYLGITVGTTSSYNYLHQTGVGAISLWVKLNNASANSLYVIMDSQDLSGDRVGFMVLYDNRRLAGLNNNLSTNAVRCYIGKGVSGSVVAHLNAKNGITDNNWHHILYNVDVNNAINDLYIDTVLQTDLYYQFSPAYNAGGGGNAFRQVLIMRRAHTGTPRFNLLGSLQHVNFFKKPLSYSDIKRVYNGLHPFL